jgi:hypothetical protein
VNAGARGTGNFLPGRDLHLIRYQLPGAPALPASKNPEVFFSSFRSDDLQDIEES